MFSVDTAVMACRQSKIRDCRDTVDDRLSTTALILTLTVLKPPYGPLLYNEFKHPSDFMVKVKLTLFYLVSTDTHTDRETGPILYLLLQMQKGMIYFK